MSLRPLVAELWRKVGDVWRRGWRLRDLSKRRYVVVWADGISLQGRPVDEKQCVLVLIGAMPEGRKELPGFQTGFRESARSWRELPCSRSATFRPSTGKHIRTTKSIESVFATVRHRTVRIKGCLSHKTALAMVCKLLMAASKTWRRLNGYEQLFRVIEGVESTDGIQADETETRVAA